MAGEVWKKWYMERLTDPPRNPAHRNWLSNTMTLGTGRSTIESFARALLPPAIAKSYVAGSADWTRLRLGHLYLLGLGGPHPVSKGMDPLTLSRMAYHVRHMRTYGGQAVPNYDLDTAIKKATNTLKRAHASGQGVISEQHFQNILEAATRGVAEDRARALTLGLNLMYYCGIRPVSLSQIRWTEILDIAGSRFLWARGRLFCLPAHIEDALRRHRETASPARKVLFDTPTMRALHLYSVVADTLGVLRTIRG
ncbi:MAG: hypothetical protein VW405_00575 [Rhodospirillaceae bacterium]